MPNSRPVCTADCRRRQNPAAEAEWLEQRATLVSVAEANRSSRSQKQGSGADDGDAGDNDAAEGDADDDDEGDAGNDDAATTK